jgi:hypothetical protein
MTRADRVKRLKWHYYVYVMRCWRLSGEVAGKPRAAFQIGRHIESLPVEVNAESKQLPAVVEDHDA